MQLTKVNPLYDAWNDNETITDEHRAQFWRQMNTIMSLPDDLAIRVLWDNASYTFSLIALLANFEFTKMNDQMRMRYIEFLQPEEHPLEIMRVGKLIDSITKNPPRWWRGIDLKRCGESAIKVAATINAMSEFMTQAMLDFMIAADRDAIPGMVVHMETGEWEDYLTITKEESELALAFRQQMVEEAAPVRHQVVSGSYVMEREPFPRLDSQIDYELIRLIIRPEGIYGGLYVSARDALIQRFEDDDGYREYREPTALCMPFIWTPEGLNTGQVWLSVRGAFALDALLACIWRDACVVKEKWVEKQRKRGYEDRKRNNKGKDLLILPRVIYHSRWGVDQAEREQAIAQARAAHERGGCYPKLPEGWSAHEAAERAAEYHYPPPPKGHTFRRPYTTSGEKPEAFGYKQVICRGLQVAHHVLG